MLTACWYWSFGGKFMDTGGLDSTSTGHAVEFSFSRITSEVFFNPCCSEHSSSLFPPPFIFLSPSVPPSSFLYLPLLFHFSSAVFLTAIVISSPSFLFINLFFVSFKIVCTSSRMKIHGKSIIGDIVDWRVWSSLSSSSSLLSLPMSHPLSLSTNALTKMHCRFAILLCNLNNNFPRFLSFC